MGRKGANFSASLSPPSAHHPPEMSKRRKILLLLAGVGLAIGVYMLFIREGEPSYKGQTLSQWVKCLGATESAAPVNPECQEAFRHMGRQAVPHLLRWIDKESPSAWRENLDAFCQKHGLLRGLAIDRYKLQEEDIRAAYAARAFAWIGPEATNAIPALRACIHKKPTEFPGPTYRAAWALAYIGGPGLAPLAEALGDTDAEVRRASVYGLRYAGAGAGPVIPAIVSCLQDTNAKVRWMAIGTLGYLKLEPGLVVPRLEGALQDQDASVRRSAVLALREYGDSARKAMPGLQRAANDGDLTVRSLATNALDRLRRYGITNAPAP
jgi:hypothetical protein